MSAPDSFATRPRRSDTLASPTAANHWLLIGIDTAFIINCPDTPGNIRDE